ncbi:unnamed protein product [Acanthoscelides obtectus]|uniref:Uncharacterized protein n=1 Tax=Acanthoscelides obtectus TaxID=200917 RepID=A0A9P0PE65_ACAOB|nr:unnamed protein product [Acanthoscelides obtectus]CAK1641901.1 hypothetical protein AOBTE_LOCUS12708 [Acanthoscelides obtectus]
MQCRVTGAHNSTAVPHVAQEEHDSVTQSSSDEFISSSESSDSDTSFGPLVGKKRYSKRTEVHVTADAIGVHALTSKRRGRKKQEEVQLTRKRRQPEKWEKNIRKRMIYCK